MENASKALVMAGGILIALLVIGALLLMFNQVSDYQRSGTDLEKDQQLTDFNKEFTQFTYGDIKGYELISLVNKVIDYNGKSGTANYVDYSLKITVKIENLQGFAGKYGTQGKSKLFGRVSSYIVNTSATQFITDVTKFRELENTYSLATMSKLSANYDTLKNAYDNPSDENGTYEGKMQEIVGRVVKYNNKTIKLSDIENYREYSEFKTSTFESSTPEYYSNGQVKSMAFKFVK
ncbi:MAG: hypothetical protein V8R82_02525 [Clostridia bacterium]